MTTRLTKIGFSSFDGTMLREWVSRCEQFFLLDNTPPEMKVHLASLHMEGKAQQWHHNFLKSRYDIFPSWPKYFSELSSRFRELFDDPLSELVSLQQAGDSIETYLEKFDCALTMLSLPVPHAMSIFLTNMNQHLALHVRHFEVKSVYETVRILKLHESALLCTPVRATRAHFSPYSKAATNSFSKNYQFHSFVIVPTNTETPRPPTFKLNFIPHNTVDKTPKKFTYEKMQERQNKRLCMFYDEVFTPGHQLNHKRAQIFLLDYDEDYCNNGENLLKLKAAPDLPKSAEKALAISLNALSGSTGFSYMQGTGQYGQKK